MPAPVLGGSLANLGALGGIGAGFERGMSKTQESVFQIREQNIRWRLGIGNLTLGVKRLEEARRQADLQNKQYYDGLRQADLLNIRNVKATRALEMLRNDHELERLNKEQEFTADQNVMERIHARKITEMTEAGALARQRVAITPGVMNARIRADERTDRVAAEADVRTREFIASKLTTSDGTPPSGQAFHELALRTFPGMRPSEAKQLLIQQWQAELSSVYANRYPDITPPSVEAIQALSEWEMTGDARANAAYTSEMGRQSVVERAQVRSRQTVQVQSQISEGGSASVPLVYDMKTGKYALIGAQGEAIRDVFEIANDDYPVNGQGIEAWTTNLVTMLGQVGIVLGENGNLSPVEMAMLDVAFKAQTGREIQLGPIGIEATRNVTGLMGATSAAPVVGFPEGTTPEQAAQYPAVLSGYEQLRTEIQEEFARLTAANASPLVISEFLAGYSGKLEDLIEGAETRLGPAADDPVLDGHVAAGIALEQRIEGILVESQARESQARGRLETTERQLGAETRAAERKKLREQAKTARESIREERGDAAAAAVKAVIGAATGLLDSGTREEIESALAALEVARLSIPPTETAGGVDTEYLNLQLDREESALRRLLETAE